MSIAALGSIDLTSLTTQTNWKSLQKVGQDLKSGDLSAAQTDFATLMAAAPSATTPVGKAYTQLESDLQTGNLTSAQHDYATLKHDLLAQSANSPVLRAYAGASALTPDTRSTLSVNA